MRWVGKTKLSFKSRLKGSITHTREDGREREPEAVGIARAKARSKETVRGHIHGRLKEWTWEMRPGHPQGAVTQGLSFEASRLGLEQRGGENVEEEEGEAWAAGRSWECGRKREGGG